MNDPAVLLYTSDFLTGVLDLTMEERGQYITLLCFQHQKGHLKEETIRLLVGNVSVNVLNKFKKDENGYYYNERMESEKSKRDAFINSRKENGKKGGRPKKPLAKPNGKPSAKPSGKAKHNLHENDNDNENINILINYISNKCNYILTNTPIEINTLNSWLEKNISLEIIKESFDEMRRRNIADINYVNAIVESKWAKVKNKKADIELPEWFDKEYQREELLNDEERRILEEIENSTNKS